MLRYLRKLSDKDLALDRAMIPLGSCTMKLNATSEMIPVTWREFAHLHPFAPADQAAGYREMIEELERMLCACTGYDAVSLQPNAGSQGEYAGLLIIQAWHASRGRGAPQRLPDSVLGARHQSGLRADGRHARRRRRVRRGRQRRPRRPRAQGRGARERPRRDHGDLPVHARRVRGGHRAGVRDRARARRAGVRRRREPERAGGHRAARAVRRRRLAPQPAQDVLHPARRRRPRRRPGRRQGAPRALPPRAPVHAARGSACTRSRCRRALRRAARRRSPSARCRPRPSAARRSCRSRGCT